MGTVPGRVARMLGTAMIVAALGVGSAVPAHAQHSGGAEYRLHFTELRPGVAQVGETLIHLPREAVLRDAPPLERTGVLASARVDLSICPPMQACLALADATGRTFAAGATRLVATVTLPEGTSPGATGTLHGRLVFAGDDDLALTGGGISPAFAIGGAGAVLIGIILAARRRRKEEDHESQGGTG